jgi:hypothetical protein
MDMEEVLVNTKLLVVITCSELFIVNPACGIASTMT